jgi:hypothetical protein
MMTPSLMELWGASADDWRPNRWCGRTGLTRDEFRVELTPLPRVTRRQRSAARRDSDDSRINKTSIRGDAGFLRFEQMGARDLACRCGLNVSAPANRTADAAMNAMRTSADARRAFRLPDSPTRIRIGFFSKLTSDRIGALATGCGDSARR